MLQNNFDHLVEKDGKTLLQDERTISIRTAQIAELQSALNDCAAFLRENDFPRSEDDIFDVLEHGRDGLRAVVWRRADREAERLNVRSYVIETWREQERAAVTHEQWEKADDLMRKYGRAANGLPFGRDDVRISEDGTPTVDAVTITVRIEDACTIEITEEMQKQLEVVLDLASKVEAVEVCGVNALELIGRIVRQTERPSEADLYNAIVFRRHQPGTVHNPGTDWIMNQAAINNPNFNPLNN